MVQMRNLQYQASHDGKVKLFFIKSTLIVTIIFAQFKINALSYIAISASSILHIALSEYLFSTIYP